SERYGLLRVDERDRGRPGRPGAAVRSDDLERIAWPRQVDRHPDVADVLLEPRRPDEVRHGTDGLPVGQRVALARQLERERVAGDLDPDQLAIDTRRPGL